MRAKGQQQYTHQLYSVWTYAYTCEITCACLPCARLPHVYIVVVVLLLRRRKGRYCRFDTPSLSAWVRVSNLMLCVVTLMMVSQTEPVCYGATACCFSHQSDLHTMCGERRSAWTGATNKKKKGWENHRKCLNSPLPFIFVKCVFFAVASGHMCDATVIHKWTGCDIVCAWPCAWIKGLSISRVQI